MLPEKKKQVLKNFLEENWLGLPEEKEARRKNRSIQNFSGFSLYSMDRTGPFSNWVIPNRENIREAEFTDMLKRAENFFSERETPFSWEVFEDLCPWLEKKLLQSGYKIAETVKCMVLELSEKSLSREYTNRVKRVKKEVELYQAMKIDDSYDEHNTEQFENAYASNKKLLGDKKYLWVLGFKDKIAASSACIEFFEEQKIAYLGGATTLTEFRRQGFYTDLLFFRLFYAYKQGFQIVATHADSQTSAPILIRNGFETLSCIKVFQKT
ncbi:hypothetical protein ACFL35_21300 [Candidatus Riflebacteria bacterium]